MEAAEVVGMPPSGAAKRAVSPWRIALVVIVTIPVLLACAQSAKSLASAPASSLRIYLHFEEALIPGDTVRVITEMKGEQRTAVKLTGGQTLAIDGAALDSSSFTSGAMISRHTPGGTGYAFVYTDEHGHQTVVHVPAPREDFKVLSPTPGGLVPLPRRIAGSDLSAPTPTPLNGPQSNPNQPRPPAFADTPLTVRHTLPYLLDSLPQAPGSSTRPNRYQLGLFVHAPPPEACATAPMACPPIFSQQDTPTETTTLDDRSWSWGTGFETLAPGPGSITASVDISWNVPHSGFLSFYVM